MGFRDNRWLMGCGIGCGVVLLLGILLTVGGGLWIRGQFSGLGRAEDSREELADRFGAPADYVPAADHSIAPRRMEIFLAVRDSLRGSRSDLERISIDFPARVENAEGIFSKITAAISGVAQMIEPIAGHVDRRNRLLLDAGMGLGEYLHIYSTAFYGWLGKDAGEGPTVEADGARANLFDGEDAMFGPRRTRKIARRTMMAFLRNSVEGAVESGADAADVERLEAELRRCELSPRDLPWSEGLPPPAAASCELFRRRLEASWHGATNCFEFPRNYKRSWEISVDDD